MSLTRTRINLLRATVSLEELAQLHQPIVDALICGDGKTAEQLLRKHLEAAQLSEC
ncbi:MAG: FCD domain-containing protein [Chroococcidiopsidaceae cyanobacterium CP_BM_ER_R8_30]|nr:FCD domain-containing protein [Chroococcidiopsidaceae cyanobacterium CP_BM_ER_R8_30]